jgi:hypothetical protein
VTERPREEFRQEIGDADEEADYEKRGNENGSCEVDHGKTSDKP